MKKLLYYEIISFLFTSVLGTLLHYFYEFSGENVFVSLFSPVNESVWEHLKLVFFPMFVFSLLENYALKNSVRGFYSVKLFGILFSLFLVPILFYAGNCIFGPSHIQNIIIFYISVFLGHLLNIFLFKKDTFKDSHTPLYLLFVIMLLFMLFTCFPPDLPLFKEPE